MIEVTLQDEIKKALKKLGLSRDLKIELEHPADENHGDWSTNVALQFHKEIKDAKNPKDLAEKLVEILKQAFSENTDVAEITIAGPGFINFKLSEDYFLEKLSKSAKNIEINKTIDNEKLIFEYMQPNTNKPLHVGHLRNSVLGVSMMRILKEIGWDVKAATINNDRGLHITKSMWGYLMLAKKSKQDAKVGWKKLLLDWEKNSNDWLSPEKMKEEKLKKEDVFLGHWYVQADKFAKDDSVQLVWKEMLNAWENKDDKMHTSIRKLWKYSNDLFYKGYQKSIARLGVYFDKEEVDYESKIYEAGKEIILKGVEKGIFEKLEGGAVAANLDKHNLPDKVLLRSDGTSIYMTFDIELTRKRVAKKAKKLIWEVGSDQDLYFKQLFAISEMLGFGKKENFKHFSYGMVRLPEGKMSSRKGTVLYADDVMDLAEGKALEVINEAQVAKDFSKEEKNIVVGNVGLGALKWSLLSVDPVSDVAFDLNKSVSFSGFSGPYVQYGYARTQSVLAKINKTDLKLGSPDISTEEAAVIKHLAKFPEVITNSAEEYAPHLLAIYIYELTRRFNTFYNKHPIVKKTPNQSLRIMLTKSVALALEKGLYLLGIAAPTRM